MAQEGPAVAANRNGETSSIGQWWEGGREGLGECWERTEAIITQQILQAGRCWCVMTRTLEQGLLPEESQQSTTRSSE